MVDIKNRFVVAKGQEGQRRTGLRVWGQLMQAIMYCCFQSLSPVQLFATPCSAANQPFLVLHYPPSLLKFMSFESVMLSNHLILWCPILLLPSIFSSIRVFSNESALHMKWPKYWSFSFSISPSNECSQLISFRIDGLDFLAVQRTLKSLLQHHNSKALILRLSAFFVVQLSHPNVTTGKTIVLTIWTFVSKVMSLLFNTLSIFVIAFLPRSKHLLLPWLQSPPAVIFGVQENKICHCFYVFLFYLPEVLGPDAMILVFEF